MQAQILKNCKSFLLDCDGVIWRGGEIIPKADVAVRKLRENGYLVAFVTNNSRVSREEFMLKLCKFGFQASENECYSTSFLTAIYLKSIKFSKSVYVIGSEGLCKELNVHGFTTYSTDNQTNNSGEYTLTSHLNVGAVVVGLDPKFNYEKIATAMAYLKNPAVEFVATNTDVTLPSTGGKNLPGAGTMIAAVKAASGREPIVMGKPSLLMFNLIKEHLRVNPETTCMVGDRIETDIQFGKNCGMRTALVFSGVTSKLDLENWNSMRKTGNNYVTNNFCEPDATFDSLNDLVETILK